MKKIVFITVIFFLAIPSGFAQLKMNTFEEAEQFAKENPKPIVIFTHTNWCKYCKIMENTTFKNAIIIKKLNDNFYFVPFDAETKRDIKFNDHVYKFKPTGTNTGIHELATALVTIDKLVVYPSLTILNSDNSILFRQHSYLSAKALSLILDKLK